MHLKNIAGFALVALLAACGGGGTAGTSSTVSGVAAVGAPMAGAVITLTDANGNTASTTAGTDGSYSLNVAGLTAPYVISASGQVGDGQTTQVSVVATAPTSGGSVTANINPLTNAVAAKISSSSDPASLADNISSEKANITSSSIASTVGFLNQALNSLATSAGALASFNPISDSFVASGTGLDKLFDNVEMQALPGTGVNIFVKDAVTLDDMAVSSTLPSPTTPTISTSTISLGSSTNLSSVPNLGAMTIRDYTVAQNIPVLLNTCFSLDASTRASNAACTSDLTTPDYLNNAKTISQELTSWMSSTYTGSTFTTQVIRFYTNTRALVKIAGKRSDGVVFSFYSVIAKVNVSGGASTESTSGNWMLKGNQRDISVAINARAMRQVELNSTFAVPSGYFSTLVPKIDIAYGSASTIFATHGGNASNPGVTCTGSACSFVRVSGPALTTPLIYKRNAVDASCNVSLVLATSISASPASCTSVFKINGVAIDSSKSLDVAFDPAIRTSNLGGSIGAIANYTSSGKASVDTAIAQIAPYAPYIFEIYDGTTGNTTYYVERLRGRPLTTAELTKIKWLELTEASKNQLLPTTLSNGSYAGGNSITFEWTRSQGMLPAFGTFTQFQATQNGNTLVAVNKQIPVSGSFGTQSATITVPNAGTFPAAPSNVGRSWFGLTSLNADSDSTIYSAWSYSN
jgi:hypothetical protein